MRAVRLLGAGGCAGHARGVLAVEADNPSGLPQNDFRVTVPVTFGQVLRVPFAGPSSRPTS